MKKIWIVDDDEEMTGAVRLMLKMMGYETSAFFNARTAAQALIGQARPDLLILDINMPEVSGLDLLEFLRRRDELKDIPVVMLSTEASDVMVDRASTLGADAYVSKPVTIEELQQAMNIAFNKRKS